MNNILNPSQQEAVMCIDAPSLVIAGAGSGKTRVLTHKIAYLLEHDYKPWNILALTFTNKAAREMQERVGKLVSHELAQNLWMGTFHSIFARILRIESGALGFSSNFTIYDAADSKSLIRTIIRELGLDEKVYKPSTICNHISEAKNALVFPDAYTMSASIMERDNQMHIPATRDIYLRYMQRCRLSDAMDFDDLLLYTYFLFDKYPEIRKKYENKFQYVLVDEYQDTNYAQHRIVWQLTQHNQRVCVVGDDAQSIYSFRGANIDNILQFQSLYQGAKLFKLEQNYRSTQTIVNAANSLISHNQGQIKKNVFSEKSEGKRIYLYNVASDYEEAIVVAQRIHSLHVRDHYSYGDFAILYRTNSQSRALEEQLRKLALPYRIYGGLSFYQRKEIKDVIAYLRLAINPKDEEAMKRVINYPARGIGETTLTKVLKCASEHNVSPWKIVLSMEDYGLPVNKGTQTKLNKFAELIMSFHALIDTTDAYTITKKIVQESGVAADINSGKDPEDMSRQENLQELLDSVASFVQERSEEGSSTLLTDYLQEVSLLSDIDENKGEINAPTEESPVTLMTIHSAKGLEFRIVFVVGLEEELFPNQMALQEGNRGLEEERRLMYVAMTRAEEQLYLSTAKSRFRFGKTELSTPSRFLNEIDERYINRGQSSDITGYSDTRIQRIPISLPTNSRNSNESRNSKISISATSRSSNDSLRSARKESELPSSVWGKTLKRVSSLSQSKSQNTKGNASSYIPNPQSSAGTSQTNDMIKVGTLVDHNRFGRGTVQKLEGTGLDAKATVRFENVGTKILLLRFSKLSVIK